MQNASNQHFLLSLHVFCFLKKALSAGLVGWLYWGDAYVFPGFLTPVLTQLLFPKPPTTFLTCFCRGERQKNARKKVRLNRGSNSQPPGQESDTLTTEPPGRDTLSAGPSILWDCLIKH